MAKQEMIFPEVFITGKVGENADPMALCADALIGWANCMHGSKPPANFGHGMVDIGKILGIAPTAENIEKYAKEKGWLNE